MGALREGPEAHAYASVIWKLPRVAKLIQRELGIKYHLAHLSRVLRALAGVASGRQKTSSFNKVLPIDPRGYCPFGPKRLVLLFIYEKL